MTQLKKMTLPKPMQAAYKTFFKGKSLYAEARVMGVDVRTLQNALSSNKCSRTVMDKINDHILSENKKMNDLTKIINPHKIPAKTNEHDSN